LRIVEFAVLSTVLVSIAEKESFGALVQLKDACLHVKICNYVSPSEIHLQLVQTDKTACQELMKKMQMTYWNTKPDNMVKWEVGWFCAAFLMSKNIWYRGKITNATPKKQSFQVFLIDYGSTHMISEHNLRRVHKQFQTIPCLSFCCKLSDLRPGNSNSDPRLGNSNSDPRQGNSSSDPRLGNRNSDPRLGNSHSDPRLGNSNSDPRLGNSHSDPRLGNSHSDPRLGNSHSDPRQGNSNSDPRLGNSNSDPRLGNSNSDPKLGNSNSDPRLGNSNSDPRRGNSCTDPRLGNSNSDPRLGNSCSDSRLGNSNSDRRLGNSYSDPRLENSHPDPRPRKSNSYLMPQNSLIEWPSSTIMIVRNTIQKRNIFLEKKVMSC
ncbi:uncharacterized protein LOC132759586, partial [Ruditapes philippinarum]|uniref:uncharacterized protein LOC132759586 n=1 Tax=Ruditapes philippinarum TaxID=129788 RepID=UPI00295B9110